MFQIIFFSCSRDIEEKDTLEIVECNLSIMTTKFIFDKHGKLTEYIFNKELLPYIGTLSGNKDEYNIKIESDRVNPEHFKYVIGLLNSMHDEGVKYTDLDPPFLEISVSNGERKLVRKDMNKIFGPKSIKQLNLINTPQKAVSLIHMTDVLGVGLVSKSVSLLVALKYVDGKPMKSIINSFL